MTKKILLTLLLIGSIAAYSQRVVDKAAHQEESPKTLLEEALTQDGSYRLSTLLASPLLTEERKAAFREADLDENGLISLSEYDALPNLASAWAKQDLIRKEKRMIEEEMRARLLTLFMQTQETQTFDPAFLGERTDL